MQCIIQKFKTLGRRERTLTEEAIFPWPTNQQTWLIEWGTQEKEHHKLLAKSKIFQ